MFVLIVSFDNADPAAYGPFATREEAERRAVRLRDQLGDDDSVTGLTVSRLGA